LSDTSRHSRRAIKRTPKQVIEALKRAELFDMCEAIAKRRGENIETVVSRVRYQNIIAARHEMMAAVRAFPGRSYSLWEIGDIFGVDCVTVINALKRAMPRDVAVADVT
jgi:chromosomal replication initiation ATPase DnaA